MDRRRRAADSQTVWQAARSLRQRRRRREHERRPRRPISSARGSCRDAGEVTTVGRRAELRRHDGGLPRRRAPSGRWTCSRATTTTPARRSPPAGSARRRRRGRQRRGRARRGGRERRERRGGRAAPATHDAEYSAASARRAAELVEGRSRRWCRRALDRRRARRGARGRRRGGPRAGDARRGLVPAQDHGGERAPGALPPVRSLVSYPVTRPAAGGAGAGEPRRDGRGGRAARGGFDRRRVRRDRRRARSPRRCDCAGSASCDGARSTPGRSSNAGPSPGGLWARPLAVRGASRPTSSPTASSSPRTRAQACARVRCGRSARAAGRGLRRRGGRLSRAQVGHDRRGRGEGGRLNNSSNAPGTRQLRKTVHPSTWRRDQPRALARSSRAYPYANSARLTCCSCLVVGGGIYGWTGLVGLEGGKGQTSSAARESEPETRATPPSANRRAQP